MIVRTAEGGADCVVYDWASGSFVTDRSYFTRTIPSDFKDVDTLTEEQMRAIVAGLRADLVATMAHRLGERTAGSDDVSAIERLGLDPAVPPFDGDHMETLAAGGLLVIGPELVVRHLLDAALGPPGTGPAPADCVAAVYTTTGNDRCQVMAVFPTDAPTAEAVLLQFAPG
jgi:hypothetical protein